MMIMKTTLLFMTSVRWPVVSAAQSSELQRLSCTANYNLLPDMTSSFHTPGQSLSLVPTQ